jgi:hypothetical protein
VAEVVEVDAEAAAEDAIDEDVEKDMSSLTLLAGVDANLGPGINT